MAENYISIKNLDEFERMYGVFQKGVEQEDGSFKPLDADNQDLVMRSLTKFKEDRDEMQRQINAQKAEGVVDPKAVIDNARVSQEDLNPMQDILRNTGETLSAALQVGATIGTSAIAEPVAGWVGLANLIGGAGLDGNLENAVRQQEAFQDANTFAPKTQRGEAALQGIVGPLSMVEEGLDRVAGAVGMGSPAASTFIKTLLVGGLDIYGAGKFAQKARISKQLQTVYDQADSLGIDLSATGMQNSVIDAANRMTPEYRNQNARLLQNSLMHQRDLHRAEVDASFKRAREGEAFVQVDNVKDFGKSLEKHLIDEGINFEITGMKDIVRQLDRLQEFGTDPRPGAIQFLDPKGRPISPGPARINQQFRDVETVRRTLVDLQRSHEPGVGRAATIMKHKLDDFMDHQLMNDLIDGDPKTIADWKQAREGWNTYKENWDTDRMIKNLVAREANETQIRQWAIGLSQVGGKAQAADTLTRIKNVLGKDHPAIEGIRQDLLYDMAKPLLSGNPSFGRFLANYDKYMSDHRPIVNALDLGAGQMKELVEFARTAEKAGPNPVTFDQALLVKGLATYFTGHQIARKALKVNLARKVGTMMFGIDRVTHRAIMADLTTAQFGKPFAPRNSLAAAVFMTTHMLSQAEREHEKSKVRRARRKQANIEAMEGTGGSF